MTNLLYKNTAENLTEILSRIEKGKVEGLQGTDLKNYLVILDLCEAIYDATSHGMKEDEKPAPEHEIGDTVFVSPAGVFDTPFVATVADFRDGYIIVKDVDGSTYACEPSEVEGWYD